MLDGVETQCLIDIDDTIKEVFGVKKHGAEHGYTGVRGLNAQIASITTPCSPRCWQRPGCVVVPPPPVTAHRG